VYSVYGLTNLNRLLTFRENSEPSIKNITPKNDYFSVVEIAEAVATIDADMIHRIWDEIAYRWDIGRVKRGNHIEHL
jgi:hypothetical protein